MRDFKEGFDSQRPGNDRAWKKPNHPGAAEGRLKLLQDFCKQAQEKRSFLFGSRNKSVMKILREFYFKLNPIDTTNKIGRMVRYSTILTASRRRGHSAIVLREETCMPLTMASRVLAWSYRRRPRGRR